MGSKFSVKKPAHDNAAYSHHEQEKILEKQFNEFLQLVSITCSTPIALLTLTYDQQQWLASCLGAPSVQAQQLLPLCERVFNSEKLVVLPDIETGSSRQHAVTMLGEDQSLGLFAGTPLIAQNGEIVGVLSIGDYLPRVLTAQQQQALHLLARQAVLLLKTVTKSTTANFSPATLKTLHDAEAERFRERNISNALINSLPGVFYVFDESGRFLRWNDNFMEVTGYSEEEMAQLHPLDFFNEEDKQVLAQRIQSAFIDGYSQTEAPLRIKSGATIPYLLNAVRIQIGDRTCLSGMGIDISERKLYEQSLKEAEERYRRLIELSPDAIFVMKHNRCIFANEAGLKLLGAQTQEQLVNKPVEELVHPDYRAEVAHRIYQLEQQQQAVERLEEKFIQLNGNVIDVEVSAAPFTDRGEAAHFVVARDIREAKRQKEQLKYQANYDSLTNLANRYLLHDRISQAIAYADRNQAMATVALIDLDNFKLINDSLGHDIGDQLLMAVAERLKNCVRDGDTVARHGGDEFVLVLHDHADEQALAGWIARLIQQISQPFNVADHQLFITCSIGLSVYPRDGADVKTLIKHADAAMYQAKAEGRSQFKFFIPSMNERVHERFIVEAKLRGALERGEFLLHYQPQVDLTTGQVIGAEALIRWIDPELGMQSPLKFIPVAEESGLIVPIGQWVLEQACRDNKQLHEAGFNKMTVSVNLSPRQFLPSSLVCSIQSALRHTGMAAGSLKLEVTESMVMNKPEEAEDILQELKRMGVLLAIDDFGIGYSSLSYLQRFPVDQLKIDQSFVQRVAEDPNDAAITQAVISLGHSLNLKVVAEGVSSEKQLAFLRKHACDEIQGNYFCKAVPFAQLQQLLALQHTLM